MPIVAAMLSLGYMPELERRGISTQDAVNSLIGLATSLLIAWGAFCALLRASLHQAVVGIPTRNPGSIAAERLGKRLRNRFPAIRVLPAAGPPHLLAVAPIRIH